MADEIDDSIFDSSLKKKKKKKTGFNIDAALAELTTEPTPAENGDASEPKDDFDIDATFTGKKKSKKKKPFSLEEMSDALDKDVNGVDGGDEGGGGDSAPAPADLDELDFEMDFTKAKKKKVKKSKKKLEDLAIEDDVTADTEDKENEAGDMCPDTDRDYTYEELLQRAFGQLRVRNPDMMGEKKKFIMKPPQVVRIGSKKTAFANFTDICRVMHRLPKHVLQFLLAELGTSGSIDGNNQLIIKGRFQQKQIENVLRRYIKEYVTCHTCRSPDTILQKDARLYFLQCEQCNSRCSVAPIKSGFQAVANKQQRQAIRASKN